LISARSRGGQPNKEEYKENFIKIMTEKDTELEAMRKK